MSQPSQIELQQDATGAVLKVVSLINDHQRDLVKKCSADAQQHVGLLRGENEYSRTFDCRLLFPLESS